MAPTGTEDIFRLVETIRQSGPVDATAPYEADGVAGKTIVITGGASGFGAAFARHWAKHGAYLILGDINDKGGEELVAELRSSTGSENHHCHHCDVTDWKSQVAFFQAAVRLSGTGGIDAVVANAGIREVQNAASGMGFENPTEDLATDASPPPPNLKVMDVNLTGVLYTVHLALFWLQKNGDGKQHGGLATEPPTRAERPRDRHLLLISSVAGIAALPGQPLYAATKHALVGLFRSLRGTVWRQGVRINMVCPFYVGTDFIPNRGLMLLAGGGSTKVEDVVDASTRLMADEGIVGRSLVIGPKLDLVDGEDGQPEVVPSGAEKRQQAVWEAYAHDYDSVDIFVYRYTKLVNAVHRIRGWVGLVKDVLNIYLYRKDPTPQAAS